MNWGAVIIASRTRYWTPDAIECAYHAAYRLDGQDFVCVFRERFGGSGENIALSLDGGPPHFFDAESGWAIVGR